MCNPTPGSELVLKKKYGRGHYSACLTELVIIIYAPLGCCEEISAVEVSSLIKFLTVTCCNKSLTYSLTVIPPPPRFTPFPPSLYTNRRLWQFSWFQSLLKEAIQLSSLQNVEIVIYCEI